MTEEQMKKLDNLLDEMNRAKEKNSLPLIEQHLARYSSFVLGLEQTLAEVTDYVSFREFQDEWKECEGIAKLPQELAAFHEYLSLVEQYNAVVLSELAAEGDGKLGVLQKRLYMPILISREERVILEDANILYMNLFNWGRVKERLVGEATRRAVYVRIAAVLDPEDITEMIKDGSIENEMIKAMPNIEMHNTKNEKEKLQ